MKIIPPTHSYFQEIIRTAIKINTGILCMNSPTNASLRFDAESKTSRDIKAAKQINIIDNILGAQYTNLLTLFFIFGKRECEYIRFW